jgi:hypothetical protein
MRRNPIARLRNICPYFVPPYVGPSGCVGIYLDRALDWTAVAERLGESYRLAAPKRLQDDRVRRAARAR